jgi:hypothetical protein
MVDIFTRFFSAELVEQVYPRIKEPGRCGLYSAEERVF